MLSLPQICRGMILSMVMIGCTGAQSVPRDGVTWVLQGMEEAGPLPEGVQVTLLFDGDRLSGIAGCNQYFATLNEDGEGRLSPGPVASTRKFCRGPAMDVENRYLQRLQQVHGVRQTAEGLVLEYAGKGLQGRLVFVQIGASVKLDTD